jgi:hypothetical protein
LSDPIQDAIDAQEDALIVVVSETPEPEMALPRWSYLVGEAGPETFVRVPVGEADETTA